MHELERGIATKCPNYADDVCPVLLVVLDRHNMASRVVSGCSHSLHVSLKLAGCSSRDGRDKDVA